MASENGFATNEQDVEIAKVKAEVKKYELQIHEMLQKAQMKEAAKVERTEKIVSSVERVVLGGMILGGYVFSVNKRFDAVNHMAEMNE